MLCRRDERMLLQPGDLIANGSSMHAHCIVDGFETAAATQAASWARAAGIPVIADLDETLSRRRRADRQRRLPDRQPRLSRVSPANEILSRHCALRSSASVAAHRRNTRRRRRAGVGRQTILSVAPPTACRWSTPPAPATSFMPDSSTVCLQDGRLIASLILPALPRRSTAPAPERAAASARWQRSKN